MYGNTAGTLNVYLVTNVVDPTKQKSYSRIFQIAGNHGNNWVFKQLEISSGKDFQVMFSDHVIFQCWKIVLIT